MRVKLDIENRTIIRVVLMVVGVWLAVQLIIQIKTALILILVASFLALALSKPVNYIASRATKGRGGRGLATGIAYLGIIIIVGSFVYLTVPPLVKETTNLANTIPETISNIRDGNEGGVIADFIDRYDLQDEADEFVATLTDDIGALATPVITGAGKVAIGLVSVLTVLVLTFFMLVEGPKWVERVWAYTPKHRLAHNKKLASQMQDVVSSFVNGQLLIALLGGTSSLIMMLIVGLPNAIALAGIVALFALIPMIGAIVGAMVVVFMALTQSLVAALIMLLFFITYQQIENNTIQPYIQAKALDLTPLMVLASVIIGFTLGGILGGFLAIPTVAAGQILLLDYLQERKNRQEKKSR